MTIHYAISDYTACGQFIVGRQVIFNIDSRYCSGVDTENINHTCLVEQVNCPFCLEHHTYKNAKKLERKND